MIIEDELVIQEELSVILQGNGYEVDIIKSFSNIVNEVRNNNPHLILLDIKLPGQDGFMVCSKVRSFSKVPIIFVTSCNTDMDELNSIMLGGDGFITKPYNTSILLARIDSLLKRVYMSEQAECIVYQEIKLKLDSSRVEHKGQTVELTKNEIKIISYLFHNAGKIVPRADLVEYLWDNQVYVDDNALSVYITRLREKLNRIGITDLIKTRHRQGYMI